MNKKIKKKTTQQNRKYVNATHFFLPRFLSFSPYCSIFFSLLLTVCLCFASLSPFFALWYIQSLHYPNMTKIWTPFSSLVCTCSVLVTSLSCPLPFFTYESLRLFTCFNLNIMIFNVSYSPSELTYP